MNPIRISFWYLRPPKHISRSRASMAQYTCVAGEVTGHALHRDGKRITTSPIIRFEGREFWTASGSHYVLEGEPLPKHMVWQVRSGSTYDSDNPLKELRVAPRMLP